MTKIKGKSVALITALRRVLPSPPSFCLSIQKDELDSGKTIYAGISIEYATDQRNCGYLPDIVTSLQSIPSVRIRVQECLLHRVAIIESVDIAVVPIW